MFGKLYAKWCVQQMVDDARKYFMPPRTSQAAI
jgi:hypothetical protein